MYGILNLKERKLVTYRKATTLKYFAKTLIASALKNEGGITFNEVNVKKYLNEWVELLNENSDGEVTRFECIDTIAYNHVYTNIHLYNNREPLTNEEKTLLVSEVTTLIEQYI